MGVLKHHLYTPSATDQWTDSYESYVWKPPTLWDRWRDVQWCLQRGKISEAIAALEIEGEEDRKSTDWTQMAEQFKSQQPALAACIDLLWRPSTRNDLIEFLGSLAQPLVIIGTEQNGLLDAAYEEFGQNDDKPSAAHEEESAADAVQTPEEV